MFGSSARKTGCYWCSGKKHQVLQAFLHSDTNVVSEKSQNTVRKITEWSVLSNTEKKARTEKGSSDLIVLASAVLGDWKVIRQAWSWWAGDRLKCQFW